MTATMSALDQHIAPVEENQRALSTGVAFSFGMATARFTVVPQRRTGVKSGSGLRLICPTCETATPVSQHYICPEQHAHPDGTFFTEVDMHRGREVDGVLHRVSEADIDAIKNIGEKDAMEISVVPADQVAVFTRTGDAGYRLRLDKKPAKVERELYGGLMKVLADPAFVGQYALIGSLRMGRTNMKLYKLGVWNGQLTLTELIWPEELGADRMGDVVNETPDAIVEQIKMLAEMLVEEFVPADWSSPTAARVAALDARLTSDPAAAGLAAAPAAAAVEQVGLESLLADAVAAARAKKQAAAKKAPAKKAAAKTKKEVAA